MTRAGLPSILSPRLVALALAASPLACDPPEDLEDELGDTEGDSEGDDTEFRIVDPTPVAADQLLGMVRVEGYGGNCSGMLIARDTVLTAAHCVCTQNWVGGNVCLPDVEVTFRDNPAQGGYFTPTRTGSAVHHPSYNPSWTERQVENDLAVITLDDDAPTYAPTFTVATTKLPSGSKAMVVGFGRTGSDCSGSGGTLNYDVVTIDAYEDGDKIMRFNDSVVCKGDSGGAVLNASGTVLYGVHSLITWTVSHGWVSKSISIPPYHAWVKGLTCPSTFWDRCDSKGPICQCGEGGADCDDDDDCKGSLVCEEDVGDLFGMAATADVCVEPGGPIEGTCGCSSSGLGGLCIASYNDCTPGFSAVCTPASGSCGTCSCE